MNTLAAAYRTLRKESLRYYRMAKLKSRERPGCELAWRWLVESAEHYEQAMAVRRAHRYLRRLSVAGFEEAASLVVEVGDWMGIEHRTFRRFY